MFSRWRSEILPRSPTNASPDFPSGGIRFALRCGGKLSRHPHRTDLDKRAVVSTGQGTRKCCVLFSVIRIPRREPYRKGFGDGAREKAKGTLREIWNPGRRDETATHTRTAKGL